MDQAWVVRALMAIGGAWVIVALLRQYRHQRGMALEGRALRLHRLLRARLICVAGAFAAISFWGISMLVPLPAWLMLSTLILAICAMLAFGVLTIASGWIEGG